MAQNIKDNGLIFKKVEKVQYFIQMETNIKEILKLIHLMVLDNTNIVMAIYILDILKMVFHMAKEPIFITVDLHLKVNGKME